MGFFFFWRSETRHFSASHIHVCVPPFYVMLHAEKNVGLYVLWLYDRPYLHCFICWWHKYLLFKWNVAVLQDTLNRELAKLFVWYSINKWSLNLGKTNYMLFRGRPPDLELHLKINNAEIPKVTATKLVGIVIDDILNWKPHIQSVKSKLSSILSIMYKASKLITTAGMYAYTLYCSLFQPYMSYCSKIWGIQMSNVCASFKGKLWG